MLLLFFAAWIIFNGRFTLEIVIFGMAIAITRKLNCNDMAKVVFPHPTVGEIFREAIIMQI